MVNRVDADLNKIKSKQPRQPEQETYKLQWQTEQYIYIV
jgi:hypothetical protein